MDENGKTYNADVDDAAYATFQLEGGVIAHINMSWCTRVRRDDLADVPCRRHARLGGRRPAECWSQARVNTPRPVWNPDVPQPIDFFETWQEVPGARHYDNGFKAQWEMFIRHLYDGRAVQMDAAGGRQGRAARRGRATRAGRSGAGSTFRR